MRPISALFSGLLGKRLMGKSEASDHRIINSMGELDQILVEMDSAQAVSDDELRRVFQTFSMEFPLNVPKDPYSNEYHSAQFDLYERIAGRPYSTTNESSVFDIESASTRPFPYYTGSPQTVGNHIIAIGNVIKNLDIPPPARLLEFGPGWGNTTIALARMGYDVTAVDIEKNFVDLIRERSEHKRLEIECIEGDFSFISHTDRKWEIVLFFECFHHCSNHQELIGWLDGAVASGGRVIFAAEPITNEFPIPWGFRLDGESLWAIRNFGWCELGFREDYFRDLLGRNGWSVTKNVCPETPWGTVFIAERAGSHATDLDLTSKNTFSASELCSQVGELEGDIRVASEGTTQPGFIIYGPYIELGPGNYEFELLYESSSDTAAAAAPYTVAFDSGEIILTSGTLPGTSGNKSNFQAEFNISSEHGFVFLEVRVMYEGVGDLQIHALEIRRL